MGTNSSPARWLAVVLCGIVCLGAAVPTIALWQDKPAANSDKQKKTEEERKNRSQKPKRDEKDKTRSETQARPAATPGVRVVPMNPGQAAPGQPQTGPGARPAPGGIRIERGPDGRPTVIGPDGRAVAPGPGGQAVIGAPQTPPGGPPPPGGGQTFSPSPGGMISMDFRGADINNVLKFFAMATGWQIVPDPGLSGPVTIVSPRQLTTDQAFEVLQSVLEVRGFSGQLEQRGKTPTSNGTTVPKIVPLDRAVQSTRLLANNGNLTA